MNIERLVGYTHRTPTQFVKGAVVAPRNLVMVATTVIRARPDHSPIRLDPLPIRAPGPGGTDTRGSPARHFHLRRACYRLRSSAASRPRRLGEVPRISSVRPAFGLATVQLRPHPPLGLHQRLAKRVRFGVHIVGVENGLGDLLAQELRVPTAKAVDQRFQRG